MRWLIVLALALAVASCNGSADDLPDGGQSATPTVAEQVCAETAEVGAVTSAPESRTGDVRFEPGDDVATAVAGASEWTVFVFSPGVYEGVSIEPLAGQVFLGEAGAVLQGNGAPFAFRSKAGDVVIDGLEITGYEPAERDGVVEGGVAWEVRNNHIHHNGEIAIHDLGHGVVIGNSIHHNGRYGISGGGFRLIENNAIAFNANVVGASGDSGATKFVFSTDLVIRGNHVHHNCGNGIWVDIDNVNVTVEENTVVANQWNGIMFEIGCPPGGVIRNNHVEGNGFPDRFPDWVGDTAGIVVSMTSGVEVYGNTVIDNSKGIGGVQWNHPGVGQVNRCDPQLRDLDVHDNVIMQSGGVPAGIDASTYLDLVWASWNNKFRDNTYELSDGAQFRWQGTRLDYDEWQSHGLG